LSTIADYLNIRIDCYNYIYINNATEKEYRILRYSEIHRAYISSGFKTKDELIKEANCKLNEKKD
jgi:hypothetical protein